MSATTAETTPTVYTYKGRDDYRRPLIDTKIGNQTVARMVTLPKTATHRYLVNDRTLALHAEGQVTEFDKRADALARVEEATARGLARVAAGETASHRGA